MTKEQKKLVLDNLNLVHYLIKKYIHIKSSHQDYNDYYQEGCLALVEASINFKPELGFKFSTYSSSYIYGYLLVYRDTKLPLIKYSRGRISNKKKIALYLIDNPDATSNKVMKDLNLSYKEYLEATHNIEYYEDLTYTDKDGKEVNVLDSITNPDEVSIEDQIDSLELYNNIDDIIDKINFKSCRAKQIFIEYIYDLIYVEDRKYMNNQTYYANKYGYSQAAISRIIRFGMKSLKEELQNI